jgi:hypothetical protein
MADDISVLIAKIKEFRDSLPEVLPDVATSVSMAGKAIAERTIKDKGFGKAYSTTPIPSWYFYGKELNKTGKTFLESLKDPKGAVKSKKKLEDITELDLLQGTTTWGEFRKAQGLQTDYVDLTYSGKMWAGMFPQDVQVTLFDYIAPLGNNTKEGQDKMNYNYERYGDFVGKVLTGDNMDLLYDVAYDELMRLMDEKLGWKKG